MNQILFEVNNIAENFPLEHFFNHLRGAGLQLGTEELMLAQEALQLGLGLQNRKDLRGLLRSLWINSRSDDQLFNHCYNSYLEESILHDEKRGIEALKPDEFASKAESDFAGPEKAALSSSPMEEMKEQPRTRQVLDTDFIQEKAQVRMGGAGKKQQFKSMEIIRQHDPVSPVKIRQNWQFPDLETQINSRKDINVTATIKRIAQKGFFDEPIWALEKKKHLNLVLLFDRKGSMVPMHDFCDRWATTLIQSTLVRSTKVAYFHNCPTKSVYADSNLFQEIPLQRFWNPLRYGRTLVLVITDAGAARGQWEGKGRRVLNSRRFARKIKKEGFDQIWLNPMRPDYWKGTLAFHIAEAVPAMYSMDEEGTKRTVRLVQKMLTRTR